MHDRVPASPRFCHQHINSRVRSSRVRSSRVREILESEKCWCHCNTSAGNALKRSRAQEEGEIMMMMGMEEGGVHRRKRKVKTGNGLFLGSGLRSTKVQHPLSITFARNRCLGHLYNIMALPIPDMEPSHPLQTGYDAQDVEENSSFRHLGQSN